MIHRGSFQTLTFCDPVINHKVRKPIHLIAQTLICVTYESVTEAIVYTEMRTVNKAVLYFIY